jgi:hypothetical protein
LEAERFWFQQPVGPSGLPLRRSQDRDCGGPDCLFSLGAGRPKAKDKVQKEPTLSTQQAIRVRSDRLPSFGVRLLDVRANQLEISVICVISVEVFDVGFAL